MNARHWVVGIIAVAALGQLAGGEEQPVPSAADVCKLVQTPREFAGKFVKVRGRLVRLKTREWAIHDTCWPPVLLLMPEDVTPAPGFKLSPDSDMEALRRGKSEHVSVVATFDGRIDWSGESAQPNTRKPRGPAAFGKAKLPVRMVLRRVSDSTVVDLPYK